MERGAEKTEGEEDEGIDCLEGKRRKKEELGDKLVKMNVD